MVYSASARSAAAAASSAYMVFAPAGSVGTAGTAFVHEIVISTIAATATYVGIGYAGNKPNTTYGGGGVPDVEGKPHDSRIPDSTDGARHTGLITSTGPTFGWSPTPTAPSPFIKRAVLPAAIGATVIWRWEPGETPLYVPWSFPLLFWNYNTSAGSIIDVSVTFTV